MKNEPEEDASVLSPETKALIKGLGDSPESLKLKADILGAVNELKRGKPNPKFFLNQFQLYSSLGGQAKNLFIYDIQFIYDYMI